MKLHVSEKVNQTFCGWMKFLFHPVVTFVIYGANSNHMFDLHSSFSLSPLQMKKCVCVCVCVVSRLYLVINASVVLVYFVIVNVLNDCKSAEFL